MSDQLDYHYDDYPDDAEDSYGIAESTAAYPADSSQPNLPHSIPAEQAVLGGLMLENQRFDSVAGIITDADFFRGDHALIYATIVQLAERESPFDVVTLAEALHKRDQLERVGGIGYLTELAQNTPSASNVATYAKLVRERATMRRLINAASEISAQSMSPAGLDSDDLLQLAEKKVAEIAEDRPKEGGFEDVNALLKNTVERIDTLFRSDSELTGLATGLSDLDERTAGWQPGEMIVLAARPSMGKTALALNFVEAALFTQPKPVLVFSMEMPSESLVMRMLSSIGRIDQGKIRNGKLSEEDWPKLTAAVSKLKDKPLYIDDTGGLNPQEVRARIKAVVRSHQLELAKKQPDMPLEQQQELSQPGLIMLDYLQLMTVAGGGGEGRSQEISEISRSLKGIAKEYNCPVIALSQLNRGVEQRPNKRPMNSDLRESGAIEQDADVILFIYRDEYYNEDSQDKGLAELIIGKQRNGEIGTCKAAFVGKYTRFEDLAPDYMAQDDY